MNRDMTKVGDIIFLLGLSEYDLDNNRKYNQLQEVADYFANDPNPRYQILKILNKKHNSDKLDSVWQYVSLKKERVEKLAKLDPKAFERDIEQELKQGLLSHTSKKKIISDVDKRIKELEKQKRIEINEQKKINSATALLDITPIADTLNDINLIDKALNFYE